MTISSFIKHFTKKCFKCKFFVHQFQKIWVLIAYLPEISFIGRFFLFFFFEFAFFCLYFILFYQTLGLGRKGPIKQGLSVCPSFCPSFHLSLSFLGIGMLVFSETQHGVRGPNIVERGRARFFWKNPHRAKMTKNGPKTWFLDFLRK